MIPRARIFALPVGADFASHFAHGLEERYRTGVPEDFARLEIIVNTKRLAAWLNRYFIKQAGGFLPRIKVISALPNDPEWALAEYVAPVLVNHFAFIPLIRALSVANPGAVPPGSVVALAASLAMLYDEMQGEGVCFSSLADVEPNLLSEHWQRNLKFLGLIKELYKDAPNEFLPTKTRSGLLRGVIEAKIAGWKTAPPDHPIVFAGSTGSRTPAARLMQAVASLKDGAVVLPGLDYENSEHVFVQFGAKNLPLDHAQSRLQRFIASQNLTPKEIAQWTSCAPLYPVRAPLISLAIRPAPVTDKWLEDGPKLGDLRKATQGISLLLAPDEKTEAATIAVRLRAAVEDRKSASVVTPDRVLARKIIAQLKRWEITPDESSGVPLSQTATGRFVLMLAERLFSATTLADALVFLKNPLVAVGSDRPGHLALVRNLELWARAGGKGRSGVEGLHAWGQSFATDKDEARAWLNWALRIFLPRLQEASFSEQLSCLLARVQTAYIGGFSSAPPEDVLGDVWKGQEGNSVKTSLDALAGAAQTLGSVSGFEFMDILRRALGESSLRVFAPSHPEIAIWGTLEARAHRAELTIIAGLNEDIWPGHDAPDPWLNRAMRAGAKLISPDNVIGLMAHDFQSAVSDGEVVLSRALRVKDSASVASRWLLRLENLLNGLPAQNGPEALQEMSARGSKWLKLAENLDKPTHSIPRAMRPSPCPPSASRPKKYSPTKIAKLLRDPYHIYARYILRLKPLEELYMPSDARAKGIIFHKALENFGRALYKNAPLDSESNLEAFFDKAMDEALCAAELGALARLSWRAEISGWKEWFLQNEAVRQGKAQIAGIEVLAKDRFDGLSIDITAKADRIDIDTDGKARIYDYKTGTLPTKKTVEFFDKQLLIEAALIKRGAFKEIEARGVLSAEYVKLGRQPKEFSVDLGNISSEQTWAELEILLKRYQTEEQGFTARRALQSKDEPSDYDQLSRFGEWDIDQKPEKIRLRKCR